MRHHTNRRSAVLATALLLAWLQPAAAQQAAPHFPGANLVLAGYGTTQYSALLTGTGGELTSSNNFTASLAPILLFQMGEDLLFEAEMEFGLSGEATTTTLEYAQIDYLGFESVVVVGGKFLLPFGLFGERLHASWVNKLPNAPLLYGHAHGGVAEAALLPILADAGAMARYSRPVGADWGLDVSFFVTQGPRMVTDGDEHVDDAAHDLAASANFDPEHDDGAAAAAAVVPAVAFGTSFADNNDNKMLGARVGLVRASRLEVYVSGFHAMYDADNYLDFTGANVAAEVRARGFELRSEVAFLRQEFATASEYLTSQRGGYYVQLSRAFGRVEPVARWGHLLEEEQRGTLIQEARQRLALGASYWIAPTSPLKVMYEWDSLDDDALVVQWAFGF